VAPIVNIFVCGSVPALADAHTKYQAKTFKVSKSCKKFEPIFFSSFWTSLIVFNVNRKSFPGTVNGL
jgi:hypothetical protein